MKGKGLLVGVFIWALIIFTDYVIAQPELINDILVDTQGTLVKVSINSSQPLPIETFKKESPANYIIIDFLGTVYTNLPPIIKINKGIVKQKLGAG